VLAVYAMPRWIVAEDGATSRNDLSRIEFALQLFTGSEKPV
jgi:hypothetical protein